MSKDPQADTLVTKQRGMQDTDQREHTQLINKDFLPHQQFLTFTSEVLTEATVETVDTVATVESEEMVVKVGKVTQDHTSHLYLTNLPVRMKDPTRHLAPPEPQEPTANQINKGLILDPMNN